MWSEGVSPVCVTSSNDTAPDAVMSTVNPPGGAGPFSLTVPLGKLPAFCVPGIETLARPIGSTEREAVTLPAANVAVTTTGVETTTGVVDMLKVADRVLAGMVTLDGTPAVPGMEEDSATTAPAGGARPLRFATALTFRPPATAVGVRTSDARAAGLTVSKAVFVTPL